jgi:uncharacterized protein (DUF488 family)
VLYTIGYQGRSVDELVAMLLSAGVDRLIDVRELPLSRRRGFSKTPLGDAMRASGIEYVHAREAGNPARKSVDPIAGYRVHLNATRAIVPFVADLARDTTSALLCYEADPRECHRGILAPRVARKLGIRLVDL